MDIRVFGAPELTILAFGSEHIDISAVAQSMAQRGWVPGMVREPPGLHLMMSLLHELVRDQYLRDLAQAVADAPASQPGGEVHAVY